MYLYIMSRPHSGSTILDIIIGNGAAVESVGSLMTGLLLEREGTLCACGAPLVDCVYWVAVRRTFDAQSGTDWRTAADLLVAHTHVRHWPRTLLARRGSTEMRRLATLSRDLGRAIATATGKPHVLDSSKEPTRGLMLLRFCEEARVIHLVRDPRRAVGSHYWRFKQWGGYLKFLRHTYRSPAMLLPFMLLTALSWTIGNLLGEIARWFAPRRALRMRYEDLCSQPAIELRRIGEAFAIPLDDVIAQLERGEPLTVGHNADGNQIRTQKEVVFSPKKGTEQELPRWLNLLTLACCWPLMLVYGYPLVRQRPSATPAPGRAQPDKMT